MRAKHAENEVAVLRQTAGHAASLLEAAAARLERREGWGEYGGEQAEEGEGASSQGAAAGLQGGGGLRRIAAMLHAAAAPKTAPRSGPTAQQRPASASHMSPAVALAAAEAAAKSRMPIGSHGATPGMPRPASSGGLLQRRPPSLPAGRAANARLDVPRPGRQTPAMRMERSHREAARTARRVAEGAKAPGSDEAARGWGDTAAAEKQGANAEEERRAHEEERRAALLGNKSQAVLRAQMRSIIEARNESEMLEVLTRSLEKDLDERESALNVARAGGA